MRINYIYGGIQYDKFMNHWFPTKYGYMIEDGFEAGVFIIKLYNLDFIQRETTIEKSIRIGRRRADKFEKLYRLGNIIYWFREIELDYWKKNKKIYLELIDEEIDEKANWHKSENGE